MSTCQLFSKDLIIVSYWVLVVGVVSPMGFLWLGGFIQRTCRNIADRIEGDFGHVMQDSVQTAKVVEEPNHEKTP